MDLVNKITVAADVERTWETLLDVARVANCLPGASLSSSGDDGVFRGKMRVKLGPMTMEYEGVAKLTEVDEDGRTTTIEAQAKEAKGQGTATATIRNTLTDLGGETQIKVETDLAVTGRPAQFGRGIMEDVASQMLDEFAARLEREILGGKQGLAPADASEPASGPERAAAAAEPEPFDLGAVASGAMMQRALPAAGVAGAIALLIALLALLSRRRPRSGNSVELKWHQG